MRVEYFPRKNNNKDWLGSEHVYVPREAICSECESENIVAKKNMLSLDQKLVNHVSRCYKRSNKWSTKNNEGIHIEALKKKYIEQEGKCLSCSCILKFHTKGVGWELCLEDREVLGVWSSTDNLITVDRCDTSDPSLPYLDKHTGKENFSFLCFACNQEKYYEEDAVSKLATCNTILLKQVEELENQIKCLLEKSGTEASLESLKIQNSRLQHRLESLKYLAKNNFVQSLTINRPTEQHESNNGKTKLNVRKRKSENKSVTNNKADITQLKININKKSCINVWNKCK